MAEATVKIASPQFESVTLVLTDDEVKTLADVLRNVGGNKTYSRRHWTNRILMALEGAGVKRTIDDTSDMTGSLVFKQVY